MEERHIGAMNGTGVAAGAIVPSRLGTRGELVVGLVLSAAVFALHLVLETKLRSLGAFTCFNTLFNADPGLTLEAISSGGGGNHLSHPLLEYFFSIPIWVVAKLGALVSAGGIDEALARYSLGLVVVPAAAGLQVFVLLRLFRKLGLSFRSAVLLTLLGALSFSTLILGSIPESYVLSSLCISLAYLLFLRTRGERGVRVELAWIALGVATAGITVTNLAAVAILHFFRGATLGRGVRGRCRGTAVMAVLALSITLVAGFGLDQLFDAQPGATPDEMVWISRYFVDDPVVQLTTFPTAVINGLTPPVPGRKPNRFALKAQRAAAKGDKVSVKRRPARKPALAGPGGEAAGETASPQGGEQQPGFINRPVQTEPGTALDDSAKTGVPGAPDSAVASGPADGFPESDPAAYRLIPFSLTLQRTHRPRSLRNYIGFVLLAALAWVAFREKPLDPTLRSLARASLAVIAFNWVLHGFWGGEQFLYSQHWQVSLLVLACAAVAVFEARRWHAATLLVICVVGVALSNAIVLSKVLQALAGG